MNETMRQGILSLIHSALDQLSRELPADFDLAGSIKLINAHQIGNLVYYGAVNCGVDKDLPVMRELFSTTYKAMLVDMRQRQELDRLTAAFEENGIHFMAVKGVLMKDLYPKSDMRIMGDADILIKLDQYDKIRPIMVHLGYSEKLESDHELVWEKPSLYLELHKRLIPSYNYDYDAYYGNGWRLGKPAPGSDCRYVMTDEDHMIYLFTHFAKHYRDGGIGIRHMVDLYVYRKAKPQLDEAYIARELEKLQLSDFYEHIFRTLDVWFAGAQADEKTELITGFVFNSGAYGAHDTRHIAQGIRKKVNTGDSVEAIRRKTWIDLIFLPYGPMCDKYPVLKKAPVLLPVMWVVRWMDVLIKKPGKVVQQHKNLQLLKDDQLDALEQQMQSVGLAFHFEEKSE